MYRHDDELRNMIANRLSNAMYKAGYTYTTLALKLGRAEYTTRCWMTAKKIPTLTKFIEMAVVFNCSTDYLLGLSKDFEELKVDVDSVDIEKELFFMGDRIRNAQSAKGYSNMNLLRSLK